MDEISYEFCPRCGERLASPDTQDELQKDISCWAEGFDCDEGSKEQLVGMVSEFLERQRKLDGMLDIPFPCPPIVMEGDEMEKYDIDANGWNEGFNKGYDRASEDPQCWKLLDADDNPIYIGSQFRPVDADFRTCYRALGLGEGTVFALVYDGEVGSFDSERVRVI